ncbi:MAG: DEAD/DEAH box helicase family protein [Lentisphaeria bacterium]|nr:DEAD/DEAH box helicase family protein [Lentisphaeria bacterium]MDY0175440.1 DEAD/DEAH box helicase family protein [Lentisphaeria bacterium]NLZ59151.1 DEAD/DEAH box helicase [Lentisphaerota bacterium]
MYQIDFQAGTLLLRQSQPKQALPAQLASYCQYDPRVDCWRAEAMRYADIVTYLYRQKLPYQDQAKGYQELALDFHEQRQARPYQSAALQAWLSNRRRGLVALPTGTGKSFLALLAILRCQRSTLVVVPTLDLMAQWAGQLERAFKCPVGMLGGGSRDLQEICVSTYDSAMLQMEHIGQRFGLLVVDECHHLRGESYQQLARFSLAPFRLGLSATPDAKDPQDQTLQNLLGPICYRIEIDQLEGKALAPYQTQTIEVELDQDEQQKYNENRELYIAFLQQQQIRLGSARGWKEFLIACARQPGGRAAFEACLEQRRIARSCKAKIREIWRLLQKHRLDRMLIFTADNATAYSIGEQFFLPVLTHHSKVAERRQMLDYFRRGLYPALVTSRVLNEGVDVPEANVGVVVSGSGSTREHVQRLGRILRPGADKTAILYELVSEGTSERYVSERRRQHRAYEKPDSVPH